MTKLCLGSSQRVLFKLISPFRLDLRVAQAYLVYQLQLIGPFSCLLSCLFPFLCLVLQIWDDEALMEFWVDKKQESISTL